MDKKTVMIVDDTAYMRTLLKKILESGGYEVVAEAGDGIDALSFYKRYNPDFVTLDISMPFAGGIKALEEIKAINPYAKIIMVSALSQRKNIIAAVKLGADHFIVKPFTREKVLEIVGNVMEIEYLPKLFENMNLEALELEDYIDYSQLVSIISSEIGIDEVDAESILEKFLENITDLEKKLDESFKEKNFEEIMNIAHKLEGSLLNIRFRKFLEIAERLNTNAKMKDEKLVGDSYKTLKKWFNKIGNIKQIEKI